MRGRRIAAVLLAVTLGCAVPACGDDDGRTAGGRAPTVPVAALDDLLDHWVDATGVPGAVMAVAIGDRVVWTGAAGYGNRDARTPMRDDTLLYAASVTKTFVSALVLQLAAEGRLSLDDPLARFVPDWPRAGEITIRQLLSHTSGLPSLLDDNDPAVTQLILDDLEHAWTPREILAVIRDRPLLTPPGTEQHYTNAGYDLLGLVIEQITGQPLHDAIRDRLTVPLGLDDTELDDGLSPLLPRVAHQYYDLAGDGNFVDVRPLPHTAVVTALGAAAGLRTTTTDLVGWGHALLGTDDVLPAEWRHQLEDSGANGYGLGIEGYCPCTGAKGRVVFTGRGHDGDFPGERTTMVHYADADITIALSANQSPLDLYLLVQAVERARVLVAPTKGV